MSKTGPGARNLVPYTAQELKFAHDAQAIDGPLIDYEAKGSTVSLRGIEEIEGRKAYHLNVTFTSGEQQDVWVDAQNFLDVRIDRMSSSATVDSGRAQVAVPMFLHNYRMIEGVQIPLTMRIGDGHAGAPDMMEIERIALNPSLPDRLFMNQRPGSAHGPVPR